MGLSIFNADLKPLSDAYSNKLLLYLSLNYTYQFSTYSARTGNR